MAGAKYMLENKNARRFGGGKERQFASFMLKVGYNTLLYCAGENAGQYWIFGWGREPYY